MPNENDALSFTICISVIPAQTAATGARSISFNFCPERFSESRWAVTSEEDLWGRMAGSISIPLYRQPPPRQWDFMALEDCLGVLEKCGEASSLQARITGMTSFPSSTVESLKSAVLDLFLSTCGPCSQHLLGQYTDLNSYLPIFQDSQYALILWQTTMSPRYLTRAHTANLLGVGW